MAPPGLSAQDDALLQAQAASQAALAQLFIASNSLPSASLASTSNKVDASVSAQIQDTETEISFKTAQSSETPAAWSQTMASAASASIEERLKEAAAAGAEDRAKAESIPPLQWGDQDLSRVTPLAHFPGPPIPVVHSVSSSATAKSVSQAVLEHNASVLPDPQYKSSSVAPSAEPSR